MRALAASLVSGFLLVAVGLAFLAVYKPTRRLGFP